MRWVAKIILKAVVATSESVPRYLKVYEYTPMFSIFFTRGYNFYDFLFCFSGQCSPFKIGFTF